METCLSPVQLHLQGILEKRREASLFRSLQMNPHLIDFCSNDYLGFARSLNIKKIEDPAFVEPALNGATGSRSISGNTAMAEALETRIAAFHNAKAGLIFNSGYDANLGLFSCIAGKGDTIICDELIHASIIDGCRLSQATRFRFSHNNPGDLRKKLEKASGNVFVALESVYSMDGDMAPLKEIANICGASGASLIVDEAHATGVFGAQGRGLVNEAGLENKVFARVHTFGKALGGHGAIILGSRVLRDYLINFARSFIFTTALPPASLRHIGNAYARLSEPDFNIQHLHRLINRFRNNFIPAGDAWLIDSRSPVQSVVIKGNERARAASSALQTAGYDVRAILSPSVPSGLERLRISLHLHNTEKEVDGLLATLHQFLSA